MSKSRYCTCNPRMLTSFAMIAPALTETSQLCVLMAAQTAPGQENASDCCQCTRPCEHTFTENNRAQQQSKERLSLKGLTKALRPCPNCGQQQDTERFLACIDFDSI